MSDKGIGAAIYGLRFGIAGLVLVILFFVLVFFINFKTCDRCSGIGKFIFSCNKCGGDGQLTLFEIVKSRK